MRKRSGQRTKKGHITGLRQKRLRYNRQFEKNTLPHVLYTVLKNIEKMPHDLPVLFISGEDDPVGEEGKMVKKAFHAMQKAQLINVQIKLYPQMLHEILNEKNKLEVYEDIYNWLETNI